jgi:hypothetical protein
MAAIVTNVLSDVALLFIYLTGLKRILSKRLTRIGVDATMRR